MMKQVSKFRQGSGIRHRFLHIPKTAGTSVNVFLDRFYPVSAIWVFRDSVPLEQNLARLRSLDADKRRAIRLFRGHAPLVTGEKDVDLATTFTLLREPIERVKSFCCHVAEGKSEDLKDVFPPEKFDLAGFLDSGYDELHDLQCKMLLGDDLYKDLSRKNNSAFFESELHAVFDKLALVGTQDRYEETLLVGTLIFGWPVTNPRKKLNVRRPDNPVRFADGNIRRIREINGWDALAYRLAGKRFARTYEKYAARVTILGLRLKIQRVASSIFAKCGDLRSSNKD